MEVLKDLVLIISAFDFPILGLLSIITLSALNRSDLAKVSSIGFLYIRDSPSSRSGRLQIY